MAEGSVKRNLTLVVTSLLSILLLTFHLTQDTLYARSGTAESMGSTLFAVPVLVLLLYGTLVLAERRSGYVIMLVGSIVALGMPILHMMGPLGAMTRPARVFGAEVAMSAGALFFFWTIMALGVTGMFSLVLAARGLWELRNKVR